MHLPLAPKKSLGQNFLNNADVARKMVVALDLRKDDFVVEVGPGHGFITREILKIPKVKVVLIELDEELAARLHEKLGGYANVEVINNDILKWLPTFKPGGEFKMLGALPYNITSPFLHTLVKVQNAPETSVFMFQKEVAGKIANISPDANYLSTLIQTFFRVVYVLTVSKNDFSPTPRVAGGMIKLRKIPSPAISNTEKDTYERFLHKAFSNPRKMLNKVFTQEELEKAEIDGALRAQNLSVDRWIDAFKKLVLIP